MLQDKQSCGNEQKSALAERAETACRFNVMEYFDHRGKLLGDVAAVPHQSKWASDGAP
jgi:hypothetical protein